MRGRYVLEVGRMALLLWRISYTRTMKGHCFGGKGGACAVIASCFEILMQSL